VHDHVERAGGILDTCQFVTELVCRVPRLRLSDGRSGRCRCLGGGAQVALPASSSRLAISACFWGRRSLKTAAAWLRLDWSAVRSDHEARRSSARLSRRSLEELRHLGLDEKSFLRGQS